jgi:hypothetical protein
MSAIWYFSTDDDAYGSIDVIDSSIGVFDHEVGSDLFFRTQDDSIFALNSEYGSN